MMYNRFGDKMFNKKTKINLIIAFIIYFVVLTWIIMFKANLLVNDLRFGYRFFNIIPFVQMFKTPKFILECLMNLVVFIPFGILLYYLFPKNIKKLIVYPIVLAVLYEIVQYIIAFGSFDINDAFFNSLGGIIGIYIGKNLFSRIREKIIKSMLLVLNILGFFVVIYAFVSTIIYFPNYLSHIEDLASLN